MKQKHRVKNMLWQDFATCKKFSN